MRPPPHPGFLLVATRELRWMRRDGLALFLALGVPIIAFSILALTFSNVVIRNLKVSVVDADRSPTSLTYVQAIASAPGVSVAERSGDMTSAMHAVRSGDAIAAVYIPENFEHDLTARERPKIVVLYNRQYFTPGNTAAAAISNAIAAATATLPPSSPASSGYAPGSLVVEQYVLTNPALNYAQFLLRAILPTVLHVVTAIAAGYAVGSEFSRRSLRAWLRAAGGSPLTALVGKLAPLFAIFILMMVVNAGIIHGLFNIPFRGDFVADGGRGVSSVARLSFARQSVPAAHPQSGARDEPHRPRVQSGLRLCRRRLPSPGDERFRAILGRPAAVALVHPNSVRPGGSRTAGIGLHPVVHDPGRAGDGVLRALAGSG